ncbi:ferredoxin [Nocardioides bruguierae]|uniref:ferredoxin n=1 Tax=Nocardioides bruguierae TaxID=2945102 RepID=UPI0020219314|nr:ferredoxin [Nocardioides bruguierae]MCL8025763.1 ferredoxin [Nocardioides bruguierae]
MRVVHDQARCASIGMCEDLAPDVFEVSDDGALTVLDSTPASERQAAVRAACEACPTGALRLEE